MVFRAGKTEKLELNRVLRSDVASLAGDEAAWGDKRTCADVGPIVDPRRTSKPCRPLRCRCSGVDARLQRNTSRQTSDEAWNRSLVDRSRIRVLSLAVSRNELRCDPLLCPDRVSRRPTRLTRVARNWNFESSSLQQ